MTRKSSDKLNKLHEPILSVPLDYASKIRKFENNLSNLFPKNK